MKNDLPGSMRSGTLVRIQAGFRFRVKGGAVSPASMPWEPAVQAVTVKGSRR
jgi:hypothetical protein